jgi:hypothetical protein
MHERERKKQELELLIEAGRQMSNWLYNKSQAFNFAVYKNEMQTMVRKWDASVPAPPEPKEPQ